MNKKQLIVLCFLLSCWFSCAPAYIENYPSHKFKDGPFKHIETETAVDYNKNLYKSLEGEILIKLNDSGDDFDFILKDGEITLLKIKGREPPFPYAVYWVDLDKNGLKDFLVFSNYHACGLGAAQDSVNIFLKNKDYSYRMIFYETMSADLGDFVDLNNDGQYEIIITDVYGGNKHNYFAYSVYKIINYKLVEVNREFNGFPKFVWITYKPNDKDTTHLTKEERDKYINEISSGIQ